MAVEAAGAARVDGTVSRWTDRGFGFITPQDGGEDLFCHFSDIQDGNALEEGATVNFIKVYDERKGKERAEQVSGGITVEQYSGPPGGGPPGTKRREDAQNAACKQGPCLPARADESRIDDVRRAAGERRQRKLLRRGCVEQRQLLAAGNQQL